MLKEIIESIKKSLDEFSLNFENLTNIRKEINILREATSNIGKSWSQSWIGFHANLYYLNFEALPSWEYKFDSEWGSIVGIREYWKEKTYLDVLNYVKALHSDICIEEIREQVDYSLKIAKELQSVITTDLIIIEDNSIYDSEWQLIKELQNYSFGITQMQIIDYQKPKKVLTRDSYALQQGIQIPPHIMFDAYLGHLLSEITSFEEFIKKVRKILRQIELKSQLDAKPANIQEAIQNVLLICDRFHIMARQLRNRHQERETIKINDEYDTQDFFHALLKLYFEDVRKEEWNPSYAGGSSRSDFLLKQEKIILEIKKTRSSMSDRELGEQLIIDIAKYKQHPDCKSLICFVYDPEGIIGNSAGIEEDLSRLSTNEMMVVSRIIPK